MEAAELRAHVSVGRQFTVGVLEPVAGSTVALLREPRQPAVLELHVPSRGKSLEILRQDRKGRAWRAPSAGAFRLILEPGVACEVLVDEEVHVRLTCAPGEHRVLRLQ
jgi:hypothetical protein